MDKIRRLFLDIETSPNVVYSWRIGHEVSISEENIITERRIICACWKWEGSPAVHSVVWSADGGNEKLVRTLIPTLDQADEIVMHNGAHFDLPWIKTMALLYKIPTNPQYKVVDTCLFARKNLYFNSNKLDYLGKFLGVGEKIRTSFDLWKSVVAGNRMALAKMVNYCKQDVLLLEKVYSHLSACMPASTHAGVISGSDRSSCPHCGSCEATISKTRITATGLKKFQMICTKCHKYFTSSRIPVKPKREKKCMGESWNCSRANTSRTVTTRGTKGVGVLSV